MWLCTGDMEQHVHMYTHTHTSSLYCEVCPHLTEESIIQEAARKAAAATGSMSEKG